MKLSRCDPAPVWLADPASWKSRAPTIASAASYTADKAAACWFPSEDVARVWQAFVVDKPLVRITEPSPQGDKKPLATCPPGVEVTVNVAVSGDFVAQKAILVDRATRLGEAELRARKLAPGFHTLIAQAAGTDGRSELLRPVCILISDRHSG